MDNDNAPWFNVFRLGADPLIHSIYSVAYITTLVVFLVFELVSAFGGIGLSLGLPTDNFSFSGAFGPLSKLVVIIIMVRGRHRGLPVAVDRASKCPRLFYSGRPAEQGFLLSVCVVLLPEELVPVNHVPPTQPATHAAASSLPISTKENVVNVS